MKQVRLGEISQNKMIIAFMAKYLVACFIPIEKFLKKQSAPNTVHNVGFKGKMNVRDCLTFFLKLI